MTTHASITRISDICFSVDQWDDTNSMGQEYTRRIGKKYIVKMDYPYCTFTENLKTYSIPTLVKDLDMIYIFKEHLKAMQKSPGSIDTITTVSLSADVELAEYGHLRISNPSVP